MLSSVDFPLANSDRILFFLCTTWRNIVNHLPCHRSKRARRCQTCGQLQESWLGHLATSGLLCKKESFKWKARDDEITSTFYSRVNIAAPTKLLSFCGGYLAFYFHFFSWQQPITQIAVWDAFERKYHANRRRHTKDKGVSAVKTLL